eukprot:3778132-Prymnesium_polylepis.1
MPRGAERRSSYARVVGGPHGPKQEEVEAEKALVAAQDSNAATHPKFELLWNTRTGHPWRKVRSSRRKIAH